MSPLVPRRRLVGYLAFPAEQQRPHLRAARMARDLAFSFGNHEHWTASTSAISDRRTAEHRRLGPFRDRSKRGPEVKHITRRVSFFGRQGFTRRQRWRAEQSACSSSRCFVCMTLRLDFRLSGFSGWALDPLIHLSFNHPLRKLLNGPNLTKAHKICTRRRTGSTEITMSASLPGRIASLIFRLHLSSLLRG